MDPIASISGLASGIQWRDMIEEIIRVDRARQVGRLASQVTAQQQRMSSWQQLQVHVSKLTNAAKSLRDGGAMQGFRANVGTSASGRTLLSASVGASAAPGTYSVEVLGLARAEKLASSVHASTSDPLGLQGRTDGEGTPLPLSFVLNGRTIEVAQDASLNQIRDAINKANAGANPTGVSATVLTTAPGEHRLVLTSEKTGTAGIRLEDGEDQILSQLGISTGSKSVAMSGAMAGEPAPPLATILGLTSPPEVRTIIIDGHEILVDLTTDTLSSLLNKVHAAVIETGGDPESAARIIEETDGQGQTVHRLEVRGSVVGKWDDAETNEILGALGFTRENAVVLGTDARFSIDGFALTRKGNTVSDAIEGVTLNLQQAEPGSPVSVRITRDVDRTVDAIKAFATAYNELVNFVRQSTAPGQPLANNGSVKAAMSSLRNVLLTDLEGTEEQGFTFSRATLVGISLNRTGTLEVDDAKLRATLASNPHDVERLFAGYSDGPTGLAGRFVAVGEAITRSGDGLVAGQTDSLQRSIDSLVRRANDAEHRLELRQAALIKQFTRMEEALSNIQAQSNWLNAQIQAMQPRDRR